MKLIRLGSPEEIRIMETSIPGQFSMWQVTCSGLLVHLVFHKALNRHLCSVLVDLQSAPIILALQSWNITKTTLLTVTDVKAGRLIYRVCIVPKFFQIKSVKDLERKNWITAIEFGKPLDSMTLEALMKKNFFGCIQVSLMSYLDVLSNEQKNIVFKTDSLAKTSFDQQELWSMSDADYQLFSENKAVIYKTIDELIERNNVKSV